MRGGGASTTPAQRLQGSQVGEMKFKYIAKKCFLFLAFGFHVSADSVNFAPASKLSLTIWTTSCSISFTARSASRVTSLRVGNGPMRGTSTAFACLDSTSLAGSKAAKSICSTQSLQSVLSLGVVSTSSALLFRFTGVPLGSLWVLQT